MPLIENAIIQTDIVYFAGCLYRETNNDGRIPNLINPDLLPPDWKKSLKLFDYGDGSPTKAIFRITFYTKEYFDKLKQKTFYPYVQVQNKSIDCL